MAIFGAPKCKQTDGRGVNGKQNSGRVFARGNVLVSSFKARVLTGRSLNEEMAMRVVFISAWWREVGFRASKSQRECALA